MRKRSMWMLALCCIVCMAGTALAGEAPAPHTYLAMTSGYSETERIPGVPEDRTDFQGLVQVTLSDLSGPFPMQLPQGEEAADYAHLGLWITFDAAFDTTQHDGYTFAVIPDGILAPQKVEVIGPLVGGEITQISGDSLVLNLMDPGDYTRLTGEEVTYALTDATDMGTYVQGPPAVGSRCVIIAGADQVALAVLDIYAY